MDLNQNEFWQTQARGSNDQEYQIYLSFADRGDGIDFTTTSRSKHMRSG